MRHDPRSSSPTAVALADGPRDADGGVAEGQVEVQTRLLSRHSRASRAARALSVICIMAEVEVTRPAPNTCRIASVMSGRSPQSSALTISTPRACLPVARSARLHGHHACTEPPGGPTSQSQPGRSAIAATVSAVTNLNSNFVRAELGAPSADPCGHCCPLGSWRQVQILRVEEASELRVYRAVARQ